MNAPNSDDLKRAEELKPCPFCGTVPCFEPTKSLDDFLGWKVECRCDQRGQTKKEAISNWNKAYCWEALSDERARTLNSEAVQGLVDALNLISSSKIVGGWSKNPTAEDFIVSIGLLQGVARKAKEKFQQFKDGK